MKIATWNVNSIRQREKHVAHWLEQCQPDVLLLQEIKCETHAFPDLTYHGLGYTAEAVGQKAYNGVAVLARIPFTVRHRTLPGLPQDDAQSRYIEVETDGIIIAGIYLPNGNSGGDAGFAYKLAWLDRLGERADALLASDTPFVITGDFNVCPADDDFAPGALLAHGRIGPAGEPRPLSPTAVERHDRRSPRCASARPRLYTSGTIRPVPGSVISALRIDHALLSPTLAERLVAAAPDREERGKPQPSDHVPVVVELH